MLPKNVVNCEIDQIVFCSNMKLKMNKFFPACSSLAHANKLQAKETTSQAVEGLFLTSQHLTKLRVSK